MDFKPDLGVVNDMANGGFRGKMWSLQDLAARAFAKSFAKGRDKAHHSVRFDLCLCLPPLSNRTITLISMKIARGGRMLLGCVPGTERNAEDPSIRLRVYKKTVENKRETPGWLEWNLEQYPAAPGQNELVTWTARLKGKRYHMNEHKETIAMPDTPPSSDSEDSDDDEEVALEPPTKRLRMF